MLKFITLPMVSNTFSQTISSHVLWFLLINYWLRLRSHSQLFHFWYGSVYGLRGRGQLFAYIPAMLRANRKRNCDVCGRCKWTAAVPSPRPTVWPCGCVGVWGKDELNGLAPFETRDKPLIGSSCSLPLISIALLFVVILRCRSSN